MLQDVARVVRVVREGGALGAPPSLAPLLEGIRVGPRQSYRSLTLWPLLGGARVRGPGRLPYAALGDALEDGYVSVAESEPGSGSPGGGAPALVVENRAVAPLLVLFGEELPGATQGRAVDTSFLVPARGRLVIESRRHFATSPRVGGRGARPLADREILGAFPTLEGQLGFVAAWGGEIVYAELIGRPEVFARAFRRLLLGWALDAAGEEPAAFGLPEAGLPGAAAVGFDAPEEFLAELGKASMRTRPSLGLGLQLWIESERVEGYGLAAAGELVHLTALAGAWVD